jgi:hypothetical protein
MKKSLLFTIIFLSCLCVNAQQEGDALVSVAKFNFQEITDLSELGISYSVQPDYLELVPDGLALKNPHLQGKMWEPLMPVIGDLKLEEGHDYVVRLTLKVPSDGTYWIDMCSWDTVYFSGHQLPVKAGHDFQVIDVEYPEYGCYATDGMVFLGWGWVVGTTILKEVGVLEKTSTAGIQSFQVSQGADDAVYNLSGQKVGSSYKGIVIRNGRKVVK